MINKGNLTIGLKTKDHVILAVEKKSMKKLQKKESIKKVLSLFFFF
jgi:20S proteasome alpha/beta subunit